MNNIISKFLLAGDKFMSNMHSKHRSKQKKKLTYQQYENGEKRILESSH